jgi:hypothetical protein
MGHDSAASATTAHLVSDLPAMQQVALAQPNKVSSCIAQSPAGISYLTVMQHVALTHPHNAPQ